MTSSLPGPFARQGSSQTGLFARESTMVTRPLLGQSVGLAHGRVQVDGQRPFAGSRTSGPRPGTATPGSPDPTGGRGPTGSCAGKFPGWMAALTTQPMAPAVPPVRNTSASSMKSPPASAEATRVSSLSPGFARPGASPRSTWLSTTSRRPRCWASSPSEKHGWRVFGGMMGPVQ